MRSTALKSLLKSWGVTKVGLVYTTDDYAQGLCEAFKKTWLADGNSLSPSWDNTYSFPMGEAEKAADADSGKTHGDVPIRFRQRVNLLLELNWLLKKSCREHHITISSVVLLMIL